MQPSGSAHDGSEISESAGLTRGNLAILISLCVLVVTILVLCAWFNVSWPDRLRWGAIARGHLSSEPTAGAGNAAHWQRQRARDRPEVLQGFALENRVHPRRQQRSRTFHLPGGQGVLCVDDIGVIPEADPPPLSEEALQQQREAAERVSSPVAYGRGVYLPRLTSAPSSGSFFHHTAARGCSPTVVPVRSMVLHTKAGGDNLPAVDDGDKLGPRDPYDAALHDADHKDGRMGV